MSETQDCTGEGPLPARLDEDPGSPACSVSEDCGWGNYKRQEGRGWSVSLRQSRKGFKCQAIIDAELPVSPGAAFDILTDPEVKQWRQVKVRGSTQHTRPCDGVSQDPGLPSDLVIYISINAVCSACGCNISYNVAF